MESDPSINYSVTHHPSSLPRCVSPQFTPLRHPSESWDPVFPKNENGCKCLKKHGSQLSLG